jgi:hypothetical protein
MSGTGPGQGVTGFIANSASTFDPTKDAYPSSATPPSGFYDKNEGFAGIIHGTPVGGGDTLNLYCIDILTLTYGGIGYVLGTWDAANVPNVGWVARILDEYYPNTNEPTTLTNLNQKAAAVQAAIWFFGDRYVLSNRDPLYGAVAAIVQHIQTAGPLVEPPPPSLTLTPPQVSGPAGGVLGPFTVTTDHPPATVTATGGTMYSNPEGTTELGDGVTATVQSGQKIWLRSSGPTIAVLQATSKATVPGGNVYLYDGNSGVNDAQKLILAQAATLTTTVQATAEFLAPGSLIVKKTIAGPAAGSQGRVVIRVACDDGVRRLPFIIRAGARKGTRSRTYRDMPAGTVCTVTETSNGSVVGTKVVVIGGGSATVPSDGSATVKIRDIYYHVGSLLVRKTIAGPGAGQQAPVTIHTECNGKALTPDSVIPAGTPAGEQTKQYDNIRLPATCTATETADGHTGTVSVIVEGSGQMASVPPGDIAEADISDTYGLLPGQLEVTKTIAGPLAGQQGMVVIHTVCNGVALTPDFAVPAGTPAGDQSHIYSNVTAHASCVVTETADGHTSAVSVVTAGSPQTTTIAANGAGAAHITDTYGSTPGSLLITKTIAGPRAGHQGPVTIHVVCNGTAVSPDFVVAAGTLAGSVSHSFDGIPARSVCTVTETADGATATVTATVAADHQEVTIPAGEVVPVNVIDVYQRVPGVEPETPQGPVGSLKVTKNIAGPAAGRQGRIAIALACTGPLRAYAFLIPAHTAAGFTSRVFPELPAGSRCTVTETEDGHTSTASVVTTGRRKTVTIRTDVTATVQLTDTFASARAVPVTG